MSLVNVFDSALWPSVNKEVPMVKGAWVEFWAEYPADFAKECKKAEKRHQADYPYWQMVRSIRDWNFSGKDGKKLEVTIEIMKTLSVKLQRWLIEAGGDVISDSSFEYNKKKEK